MADLNNFDASSSVDYGYLLSSLPIDFELSTVTDTTDPVVTLISPAEGTTLLPSSTVVVEVTDDTGFGRVLLAIQFGGTGAPELVHDGDGFSTPYRGSTREAISGGWRYTLGRANGWPSAMRLDVYAIDAAGREAAT